MVTKLQARQRPAIAMVELVIAIVIMGIVMMSAPMLINTSKNSISVALQQSAINEASSKINIILTYPWDQNDTNNSTVPPVLHVTNGDDELEEVNNTIRRIGVPRTSNSRLFRYASIQELNASSIGKEGSEINDIDDFNGDTSSLILNTSGSGGVDYLEQTTVDMNTTVAYIVDDTNYSKSTISFDFSDNNTSTGTTNIKSINVTLTSSSSADELQKTIVLHAFSCNIGGIKYAHRSL